MCPNGIPYIPINFALRRGPR